VVDKIPEMMMSLFEEEIMPTKKQNERYLHHYFSKIAQTKYPINMKSIGESELHPEWPTYKTQTNIAYARYRKDKKQYIIDDINGTAGFIDFAIGKYESPTIGIEFTSKFGWSMEEIVYDFLKLLDNKNPFKSVFSYNLVLRNNRLSQGKYLINFKNAMNEAKERAIEQLGKHDRLKRNIDMCFWIIEIDTNGKKRSWYIENATEDFKMGIPNFA
jgi:hypothetical protein